MPSIPDTHSSQGSCGLPSPEALRLRDPTTSVSIILACGNLVLGGDSWLFSGRRYLVYVCRWYLSPYVIAFLVQLLVYSRINEACGYGDVSMYPGTASQFSPVVNLGLCPKRQIKRYGRAVGETASRWPQKRGFVNPGSARAGGATLLSAERRCLARLPAQWAVSQASICIGILP